MSATISYIGAVLASTLPVAATGLTITTGFSPGATVGLAVFAAVMWLIHVVITNHQTTRRHTANLCAAITSTVNNALAEQERRNEAVLDTANVIRASYGQTHNARKLRTVKSS